MCGIIGFAGNRNAVPLLVDGLRRLEYRGYDSAGVATANDHGIHVQKCAGRVAMLAARLGADSAPGTLGIAHTRWATHGPANDRNSHPHVARFGEFEVAIVHNGIIENHAALRRSLAAAGAVFQSATDSEVIAHLLARHMHGDLADAMRQVLPLLNGTYGIAAICAQQPDCIVGARLGSPLVIGIGAGEHFLASDANALAGRADRVVYLQDRQLCVLSRDEFRVLDFDQSPIDAAVETLDFGSTTDDKGDFEHFMLKEIFEQPEALENAMRGRIDDANATSHFGGLNLSPKRLRQVDRIIMTACGTSYHAALVGEYLFEELARIPVEVEYASEFRYRNPPIERNTIVLALSQSGETADTLAAMREAKRKGHSTLAICNSVGSTIAREADGGVYLHAGPEIGVASTKAFTAQVAVLTLLALYFGRLRHLSAAQGEKLINELRAVPELLRRTLRCHEQVRTLANRYGDAANMLYMGRQYLFPVALEGALKLKEISYIHAEGYPAAEMKHGPIALVDENTPSIFLISNGPTVEKVLSNVEEVRARGGPVIAVACEGNDEIVERLQSCADDIIWIPNAPEYIQPLLASAPLQLFAYHVAQLRGCDVDRPRNLAKSVTVE
jgi:glucosamine--fructose-6-phosphate aminotransferase (isomerizing)